VAWSELGRREEGSLCRLPVPCGAGSPLARRRDAVAARELLLFHVADLLDGGLSELREALGRLAEVRGMRGTGFPCVAGAIPHVVLARFFDVDAAHDLAATRGGGGGLRLGAHRIFSSPESRRTLAAGFARINASPVKSRISLGPRVKPYSFFVSTTNWSAS
jgi:hypothetical protein